MSAVALGTALPALGADGWWVMADGETYPTDADIPRTNGSIVTRGYFETLNIPILAQDEQVQKRVHQRDAVGDEAQGLGQRVP